MDGKYPPAYSGHPHGKLVVLAPGVSSDNPYIKSIRLNGHQLSRFHLRHDELFGQDALLEFEMCKHPQTQTAAESAQ